MIEMIEMSLETEEPDSNKADMKKLKLNLSLASITIVSLFTSVFAYANQVVPCMTFLKETPYAYVADNKSGETFLVVRHFFSNYTAENYLFPSGKTSFGQSNVVLNQPICASTAMQNGKMVQYATYKIYKQKAGYIVKVTYVNHQKQTLRVYPIAVQQLILSLKAG